jgi:hypothetical protein
MTPSLLLHDPAFTASPGNARCREKRGEGKTSLTTVAQSRFEVSTFQQFLLGAITPHERPTFLELNRICVIRVIGYSLRLLITVLDIVYLSVYSAL